VAEPPEPHRGLARERTILAWNRSGLAATVCIAVLLRHLSPLSATGEAVALVLIAASAILWAAALLSFTLSQRDPRALIRPHAFFLLTVATLILAIVAFALGLFASP
jgi:uncharacterized membrane protein YidH (DUF202 family)